MIKKFEEFTNEGIVDIIKKGVKGIKTLGKAAKDAWDAVDVEESDIFDPNKYAAGKGTKIELLLTNDKGVDQVWEFTKLLDFKSDSYWVAMPKDLSTLTQFNKVIGPALAKTKNTEAQNILAVISNNTTDKDGKLSITFIGPLLSQSYTFKGVKVAK